MSGNKNDNGVLEIGTEEMKKAYQADTPGQMVERYIEESKKKNDDVKQKLHFGQKFDNPLKGFPYNESVESSEDTQLDEGMKLKDIVRKHKSALMKAKRTGNLTLPQKAEDDLANWANNSGEIHGDDPDDFIDWLDSNLDDILKGKIQEAVLNFDNVPKDEHPQFMKHVKKAKLKVKSVQGDRIVLDGSVKQFDVFFNSIKKDKTFMKEVNEAVSRAQQAAIAISNKERGELEEDSFEDKSKKSGISVGTLKKVYNRGVAAWKTGHRPGTTPEQWGHARVNAFIVKKKKGNLNHDKDLA